MDKTCCQYVPREKKRVVHRSSNVITLIRLSIRRAILTRDIAIKRYIFYQNIAVAFKIS